MLFKFIDFGNFFLVKYGWFFYELFVFLVVEFYILNLLMLLIEFVILVEYFLF